VFIKPVQRPIQLSRSVLSNMGAMVKASKRGLVRNRLVSPPIDADMSPDEIARLDRWWKSLPLETRRHMLDRYDQWIVEQSIVAERQRGSRQEKRFWSLSGSRDQRAEALKKQKGLYHLWSAILVAGVFVIVLMSVLRDTTPMFYLMSLCFIALIAPDAIRQRIVRGQLLYGRRISFRELLSPLPKEMALDESHEKHYQAALKRVMGGAIQMHNPITTQFRFDEFGHPIPEEVSIEAHQS